jgi:hypothetical protein
MSMTIELPDHLVNHLEELSLMWGLPNSLAALERCIVSSLDNYNQITEPVEPPPDTPETIEKWVTSITEYDASCPVVITPTIDDYQTVISTLTYEQLKRAYPGDALIKQASELAEKAQKCLADLYSNLPMDLWGTPKAVTLWQRQCSWAGIELEENS